MCTFVDETSGASSQLLLRRRGGAQLQKENDYSVYDRNQCHLEPGRHLDETGQASRHLQSKPR
jgi:hypothetical protein